MPVALTVLGAIVWRELLRFWQQRSRFFGALVLGMNFLTDIVIAVPFLILLGGLGGFLVVPIQV
jgi:ABC-2 type transport system permease protein